MCPFIYLKTFEKKTGNQKTDRKALLCQQSHVKKGNVTERTNWRGITPLSIMSKMFNRALLTRIPKALKRNVRLTETKKQTGFGKEGHA